MKKAFTLVELLAVIVILSILVVICFKSISSAVKKSKENTYNRQVQMIEQSAQNYILEEEIDVTTQLNVDISTLFTNGYIKKNNITNPLTGSDFTGCVIVTYDSTINQNTYTYSSTCS